MDEKGSGQTWTRSAVMAVLVQVFDPPVSSGLPSNVRHAGFREDHDRRGSQKQVLRMAAPRPGSRASLRQGPAAGMRS